MNKRIAVMQPYFFPYIGYYQLANQVDQFILYDNIEFSKRGWIHRNRILIDQQIKYISLNLKKDSDFKEIRERVLSGVYFDKNRSKILRQIENSYKDSVSYSEVMPVIESAMNVDSRNLYDYLLHTLLVIFDHLNINTEVITSSTVQIDHSLESKKKLRAFCKYFGVNQLLNPIGGKPLYDQSEFLENGVSISFMEAIDIQYNNQKGPVPTHLSIIDVMMNNSRDELQKMLHNFQLV